MIKITVYRNGQAVMVKAHNKKVLLRRTYQGVLITVINLREKGKITPACEHRNYKDLVSADEIHFSNDTLYLIVQGMKELSPCYVETKKITLNN